MGAAGKKKEKKQKASNESLTSIITNNKGKCAVVVVVLISVLANRGLQKYLQKNSRLTDVDVDAEIVEEGEFDSLEFSDLINRTYKDSLLHKWEPAPVIPSDPDAPGNLGKPVVVPPEKEQEAKDRFSENEFNVVASELMSYNRTLADNRVPECASIEYPEKLPQASVVIVFHNEAWSTLLRTLWSVYSQSPRALLREIILIDDFSDREYLLDDLHFYIRKMPVKITIARTLKRTGLIQARMLGVKYARAPVIVFLDAHCECNQGWLEPLLARVAENRQAAVAPVIDVISAETFELKAAVTDVYGSFTWGLTFRWSPIPERETNRITNDRTAVIRSPAMAGGLLAIDKEFFYKIGAYDEGMKIWGGENIEMSIRLWTCGGMVEMAQCSRVGHVFRKKTPYSLPGGAAHVVHHNNARAVDVWLDEFAEFYYAINPGARGKKTDVSERLKLRRDLKCKSFHWYLKNIYPESTLLTKYYFIGQIQNAGDPSACIDTSGRGNNEIIGIERCHKEGGNQLFMLTDDNEIRSDKLCLDASKVDEPLKLWTCHGEFGNQNFFYNEAIGAFEHSNGMNCLTLDNKNGLTIHPCDGSPSQKWRLIETKLTI